MMTYADFVPGTVLGECPFSFTPETLALWTDLFSDDARCRPTMPPAMIAMVVMRAFMQILHDRPPGNIHAGQKFWISRLPELNERLVTTLRCVDKDLRNERRWVTFASDSVDGAGGVLFSGKMTTIWAI
jgi:hypothetical protein